MSQALFTVIGGTLINLAKVSHIEESSVQPGTVLVHFENGKYVMCNGSLETVLMKIGGGREDMNNMGHPGRR